MRHPIVIWLFFYSWFLFAQKDSVMVLRPDLKAFFEVARKKSMRLHFLLIYIYTKWSDFAFKWSVFKMLDQKDYYSSPYALGLKTIPCNPGELNFSLYFRINPNPKRK